MKTRLLIVVGILLAVLFTTAHARNLGTISAGSISGVTATFGGSGGQVTLNSDGITITSGNDLQDKLKFDDGSSVSSFGDLLDVHAESQVTLVAGVIGGGAKQATLFSSGEFVSTGTHLGANSNRWGTVYANNARMTVLSGTGSTSFVCTDNDGDIYAQASTCDGSAPAPSPELLALRSEVAELRAEVARLAEAAQSR